MKKIFISIFSTLLVLTGFAQNIHQRGGGTATDTCLEVGFTRKANIISAPNKTAKFVTLTDARGVEMKITVDSFATGGGAGYTNLTQFVDQTAWRSFYSNGSGDITELAFGTSGQVLTSNGASSAPTWQTPSSGSGTINSGTGFKIPFYDGTGTTLSQTSGLYYTNGTTENFGIGASAPSSELEVLSGTAKTGAFSDNPAAAAFVSPNYSLTSGGATAHFVSNSAMGADVGGSITFGGDRTSSVNNSSTTFAVIKGAKESASSGNFNGYLAIGVQNHNGGTIIEGMRVNSSGNVGIGASSTISARLHTISTTEQLRVGYDASNYYSTTVSSSGAVTLDAVGSSSGFTLSDKLTVNNDIEIAAGSGLKIGTGGAAATVGTVTLGSGTVTVNTTAICTSCKVFLTLENCTNCGFLYVSSKISNTSFTVTSSNASDASDVHWLIIKQ